MNIKALFICLFLCFFTSVVCAQDKTGAKSDGSSIPALVKYPTLNDFFPYGFWYADGCYTGDYCAHMPEDYQSRFEKIMHDLARHQINAIIPSNRVVYPDYLNTMQKYGQRSVSAQNFLNNNLVNGRTNLTDDKLTLVEEQWAGQLSVNKNHPALLAWHMIDEPHPDIAPTIIKLKEFIEQNEPTHPVIYTHQDLPISYNQAEVDLMKTMDVVLSDCYSLNEDFGYDPWLYGDVAMSEFRRLTPKALYWPIVQSFNYGKMPTLGELRVMIYHTIGCGAKGMFFFTTEQSGITWEAPGYLPMYSGPGNAWFSEDQLLGEIGRVGYYLTSAGPLLIPLEYQPKYPAKIKAPMFTTKIDAKRIKLRPITMLTRSTIHIGAFTGRDYDVLVLSNDDPNKTRQGLVSIPAVSGKKQVYDLYDLKEVPTQIVDGQVQFNVRFKDGDGRLFLVGNAEAFKNASQTVLRHRYDRQALLVNLDMGLAQAGKVDIQSVQNLLTKAADLAEKNQYFRAIKVVNQSRHQLVKVEKQNPDYYRMKTNIEAMRAGFTKIDDDFKTQPAKEIPVAMKTTMLQLSKRFGELENGFRAGNMNSTEADSLGGALKEFQKTVVFVKK